MLREWAEFSSEIDRLARQFGNRLSRGMFSVPWTFNVFWPAIDPRPCP